MTLTRTDNNNPNTNIVTIQDLRQMITQFPRSLTSFNNYVETVNILDLNRQFNAFRMEDMRRLGDLINHTYRENLSLVTFNKLNQIINQRDFFESEAAKIKTPFENSRQNISKEKLQQDNAKLNEEKEKLQRENDRLKRIAMGLLVSFGMYAAASSKKDPVNNNNPILPNPGLNLTAEQHLTEIFEERIDELTKANDQLVNNMEILEKKMQLLEKRNNQFKTGLFVGGAACGMVFIALAGRKIINADAVKRIITSKVGSIGGYEALQVMRNKSRSFLESCSKTFKRQSQKTTKE